MQDYYTLNKLSRKDYNRNRKQTRSHLMKNASYLNKDERQKQVYVLLHISQNFKRAFNCNLIKAQSYKMLGVYWQT
ncbi:hypothetical protein EB796_004719 [Bugula neritina]|uniref:Uncharacterized protein n=1 Tax=Bugula neritina TaxID=10212 RepID=A0A7J7KFF6_BUGNE|nr:hypothetical protein EB796_004719 [Bugula neritina]